MRFRTLVALPVYNEAAHVAAVLNEVRRYAEHVLVVNDGSTDGTAEILDRLSGVQVLTHPRNQGYGAALRTAFLAAQQQRYDVLVTIDCDGQHEPQRIPRFVAACAQTDVVSGSRYLELHAEDSVAPPERLEINRQITAELHDRLGLALTDAFCGFKAYRVDALRRLHVTEAGYAMPLELWVQIARLRLRVLELPVPRIYTNEQRSFGPALDKAQVRLAYYRSVIERSLAVWPAAGPHPAGTESAVNESVTAEPSAASALYCEGLCG